MEHFLEFIKIHFPVIIQYKYLFLFIGSSVEGMNTMILGGFLISTGAVAFLPIFFIFLAGETINSYIWYFVGYFVGAKPIDKWLRSKPRSEKVINAVESYFERYSGRAIIITKFTFSLTIATLLFAGSLKYDFKKFSWYNFIGTVGWVAITLSVGYFFGQSYRFFVVYLKDVTYILLFLGGAIAVVYILKWLLGSAFVRAILPAEQMKQLGDKIKSGFDKLMSNGNGKDGGTPKAGPS